MMSSAAILSPRLGLKETRVPRPIPPLRVLLVDDNGLVAKLLAMLLRLDGHEVRIVDSGFAALSCVPMYQPQVILLDINLPDMSGYEIASRLRGREDSKDIFLAAVTGYGRKEDGDDFRLAGFDCHLVKPVDAGELRRLLASVAGCPDE
jgi:two-component system CheB/CheR fusion protein